MYSDSVLHLKKKNPCPTFSVSRLCAAVCRISAHSCPSYTSLAFALFAFFLQSTTNLPLKHGPNTTYFLALVKPNRVKTCLRRVPLTSRGEAGVAAKPRPVSAKQPPVHWSGPVYWHMTLPVHTVHTVLARAIRAQPYHSQVVCSLVWVQGAGPLLFLLSFSH